MRHGYERFEGLFDEHYADVLAFAVRRCASRQDAEDVVAETFAVAWRRQADLPAGPEARLWLFERTTRPPARQPRVDHVSVPLVAAPVPRASLGWLPFTRPMIESCSAPYISTARIPLPVTAPARFDGLADDYDRFRPRYPEVVLSGVVQDLGPQPHVVDAGAGTGIVLEGLLPLLTDPSVQAFDLSADMVALGNDKFPHVRWAVGRVEELLRSVQDIDLIIAGQAYQWFDRPAFLSSARAALRSGGRLAVVQNNRRNADSVFLSAYEDLLELRSPGYRRTYRNLDIANELAAGFAAELDAVQVSDWDWDRHMPVGDFVGMSMSSTQAQRAVADVGPAFIDEVRALAARHGEDGVVGLPYRTELVMVHAT